MRMARLRERPKRGRWTWRERARVWVAVLSAGVLVTAVGGCSGAGEVAVANNEAQAKAIALFQESASMYLGEGRYDSIFVEVDAVEGMEATEAELAEMAGFLEKHCAKTVRIRQDAPIPRAQVKGMTSEMIATQAVDGIGEAKQEDRTGYIYLLLHNQPTREWVEGYARNLYPCGIYVNVGTLGGWKRRYLPAILKHECGHLMGLCNNLEHGDGAHCRNKGCVMQAAVGVGAVAWMGLNPFDQAAEGLCGECEADLLARAKSGAAYKVEMRGRFFVRREAGYWVATLPTHLHLGLGEVEIPEELIREVASEHSEELRAESDRYTTTWSAQYSSESEMARERPGAIEAAIRDADPKVRRVAERLKADLDGAKEE